MIGNKERIELDDVIFDLIWRYEISIGELQEILKEDFPDPRFRATKTNLGEGD